MSEQLSYELYVIIVYLSQMMKVSFLWMMMRAYFFFHLMSVEGLLLDFTLHALFIWYIIFAASSERLCRGRDDWLSVIRATRMNLEERSYFNTFNSYRNLSDKNHDLICSIIHFTDYQANLPGILWKFNRR